MEFLNIHLQLALINSSQKPFKSIIKKYPFAFCDENAVRSLIYNTIFKCIEQQDKNGKEYQSFTHLENYFYTAMWNGVSEIYEEEKVYSMECIPLNYEELALKSYDTELSAYSDSAEDEFLRQDSYRNLCGAIFRLEASELRSRAIRGLKRSPFLKTISKHNMHESTAWYFKQIAQSESLSDDQLAIIKGLHNLARNTGSFSDSILEIISKITTGTLPEADIKKLMDLSIEEDKASNFYGFAERFINQANIHNALFNGSPESSKLISSQRNMIRSELKNFRRA